MTIYSSFIFFLIGFSSLVGDNPKPQNWNCFKQFQAALLRSLKTTLPYYYRIIENVEVGENSFCFLTQRFCKCSNINGVRNYTYFLSFIINLHLLQIGFSSNFASSGIIASPIFTVKHFPHLLHFNSFVHFLIALTPWKS